jgi:molecular chaperone GrpE
VDLAAETELASALDVLAQEVDRLRRAVQKQGHAQELFQARVEEALGRIAPAGAGESRPADRDPGPVDPHRRGTAGGAVLDAAQRRALVELDQAILRLLDLMDPAGGELSTPREDDPRSLREGLVLLQVRARNLGRAFGLEPVPAVGHPFDDRCHEACAVAHRPDRPEGEVVEQVLPGYRLRGALLRPALVVVNRHPGGGGPEHTEGGL